MDRGGGRKGRTDECIYTRVFVINPVSVPNIFMFQLPIRIERALDFQEQIQNPDQPEMIHSSSSHEVSNAFFYLKDVWRQLGWSEASNPRPLLSAMIDVSLAARRQWQK